MQDLVNWTNGNKLPINDTKSKVLLVTGKRLGVKEPHSELTIVTSNGDTLESVDTVRLLGLDIDSKLSFSDHADTTYKKISGRIVVLDKIKGCLPLKQRILYYSAMTKPLFSYAGAIWQTASTKDCLLRFLSLQKRAGSIILNAEPRAPSVPLFNKLQWLPFYMDNNISMCSLLFKSLQLSVPEYLIETLKLNKSLRSRNTRFYGLNFITPRYNRNTEGGRTFIVKAINKWNNLEEN